MRNIVLVVLVVLAWGAPCPGATPPPLVDEAGEAVSLGALCRDGGGAAICVIKAFPGAMVAAARASEQLPGSLRRRLPIRLAFAETPLAEARIWCRDQRIEGPWICDEAGRLADGFAMGALPCWLLFDGSGRIVARAPHLPRDRLVDLLRRHLKRKTSPAGR